MKQEKLVLAYSGGLDTSYSLKKLSKEIITNNKIPDGSDKICYFVSKALMDQNFVVQNLPDRLEGEPPRQILYEDKETGFCVCGHVWHILAAVYHA